MTQVSMIAAIDQNYAIGYNNQLLCSLRDDLRHFRKVTLNKPIIMGSKTFESLGCKPLDNRLNIVLTRYPMAMNLQYADLIRECNYQLVFESFDMHMYMMKNSDKPEFVVIGGEQIYKLFLPYTSKLYLTGIHHAFEKTDAYFPRISLGDWEKTSEHFHQADEYHPYPFTIMEFERKEG